MKLFIMLISLLFFLVIILYLLPPSKVNFSDIYTKNDKASESLKEFQSRKTKLLNINGVEWKYYRGGNGDKTILFLHGMGGSYDIWWQQINAFEKEYQVLSYTLPKEITTLEQVANGIKEITKIENIDTFYAVGTSMGGYITQYLIQQIPNRLEKVVLSNTFPPNNLIQTENKKKAKIVPYLPEFILSKLALKQVDKKLVPAARNSELLAAFLPSIPFSKKQFINRYAVVVDVFNADTKTYKIKRIPKLIIESNNDPLVQKSLRDHLKKLYLDAEVYTFDNEGHFPYISNAQKYNSILSEFFNSKNEYLQVEKTIKNYFKGRKNADISLLNNVFIKEAKLTTVQDDKPIQISLENYLQKVEQSGKTSSKTEILDGNINQTIAQFSTKFTYPDKTYIDYLNLVKTDKDWKITNKTFVELN